MYLVWKILKVEMIRAYVFIPIKNVFIQNIFLLSTLSIMFLFIYTHSYNPLADKGIDLFGKVLVMLSIILVPVLFILCNPIQTWVRQSIDLMRSLQAMESKRRM